LRESRLFAWEAYLQAPTPSARDEEWRKVDLDSLDLSALNAVDLSARGGTELKQLPPLAASLVEYFPERTALVMEIDQDFVSGTVPKELEAKGVVFCTLKEALKHHPDLIRPYIVNALNDSKFVLLNKALFNCGTFLYVPKDVEITEPFICVNHFGGVGEGVRANLAVFPRIVAVLGQNSKASLINVLSSGQPDSADKKTTSLANAVVEITLEHGAKLNYMELQDYGSDIFGITRTQTNLLEHAELTSLTVGLDGAQLKSDIVTNLEERGASSNLFGIVLGDGNEHFSFNTIQRHNAPDTQSNINFRVVLKGSSSSVYQGTIEVAKVAQRIVAFQSNKNLLLGSQARADSIPRLEILADDVKCSHGATVGPVDREQIFYLQSRGLSAAAAEELIVTGFFRQILESCNIGRAKEWVYELLADKIHGK
jgi:Fe-S cluster assembly protein SufD